METSEWSERSIWMVLTIIIGLAVVYLIFVFVSSDEAIGTIDDLSTWLNQNVLYFLFGPRLPVQ